VDDIFKTFSEAYRVLKPGGQVIVGLVDKNSLVGKLYLKHQQESVFYRDAVFFGTEEVYKLLQNAGFKVVETWQTIYGRLNEVYDVQEVKPGYGEGSFVVICAQKE
jgi:ubiquinone/menaquinone biosynthesis C-methylase UbiE